MGFDFYQELAEEGEVDEGAASEYIEQLSQLFADSPEGVALADRGLEAGHYLPLFLDYALRYIGVNLPKMDAGDIREALDVVAEKVTARPEDLDNAIPELEAFCDFVARAFAFEKAAVWKRAIQGHAPQFRRAIRDSRRWGMAKSMMMEGLARGYDLDSEEGINRWFHTKQAEQLEEMAAKPGPAHEHKTPILDGLRRVIGLAPAAPEQDAITIHVGDLAGDEYGPFGPGSRSSLSQKKEKSRRKQAKASRRKNRR